MVVIIDGKDSKRTLGVSTNGSINLSVSTMVQGTMLMMCSLVYFLV
jgi:hypothetical protein